MWDPGSIPALRDLLAPDKADIKEMHNQRVIAKREKQWIHEKTDIGLIWGKKGGLGECSLKK